MWSKGQQIKENYEPHPENPLIEPMLLNNNATSELNSSDEERPQKRQRISTMHEQQQLSPADSTSSPQEINGTLVADSFEMEPDYESPELPPYYVHHDHRTLAANA